MGTMIIDNKKVEFSNEKNVLEVIRKTGIDLPTFCYYSELSIYGACRMCIVEDKWGNIFTSCSQLPKDGMSISTQTPKLRRYRKNILELLLSSHDRDCTSCNITGRCDLQKLARRFGIEEIRFGELDKKLPIDDSSHSIVRNPNKCIYCGDCVRVCEEVQGVGALSFTHRGSDLRISPAFNKGIGEVNCVDCGQCRTSCPTGAITVKDDREDFWEVIWDKNKRVVAQIAPAVRVALGERFGMEAGEVTIGKIVASLKKVGVNEVYDTAFAADMTVMEESEEFVQRLTSEENLPLFTSCCPGWVKFAENRYPELENNISSCKSPQQMFGAVVKEYYKEKDKEDGKETVMVSVMPCTAKKAEAAREEFEVDGVRDVDIVITTNELARIIKEMGIVFDELEDESLDMPFGLASGAGIIFGATGGVTEAVVTRLLKDKPDHTEKQVIFKNVRGMDNIKESIFTVDGREVKVAIVHGLKNADDLIKMIKSGERYYDFIEVMACPGGCVSGGGQPSPVDTELRKERAKGLYKIDRTSFIKSSDKNPIVSKIFEDMLKDKKHLIHVHKK
ncbi:MAG: 2Fe-2S iron-sulfur cluster binding domain-containing protein [Tissierella sp.]|nr:2Fe-2S iron-sulfur cluster binding domain-containing protein [Tissierella sp.]